YQGLEGANGVSYYNGKFYGMTTGKVSSGSTPFRGTIYEWDTTTTAITHKYDFTDSTGTYPTGNLLLVGNEFYGLNSNIGNYGTTSPCLFKWNPATNVLDVVARYYGDYAFGTPTLSGGKIYFMKEGSFLQVLEYDPVSDTTIIVHNEPIPLFQFGGNWNYTNCTRPPSYQQLLEVIPNQLPVLVGSPSVQNICANRIDSISFTITDADADTMHFQITSSNPALIPVANISTSFVNSNYSLHYFPQANQSGSTTISVNANDGYGGTVSFSFTININPLPTVSSTSLPAIASICEGESITLNGTGATTYTWSGGIINNMSFVPPVGTSTYTVTGIDANGCSNTSTQTVVVKPNMIPTLSIAANVSQGNNGDAVIYTATTNLANPYTIDWYRDNIFQTTTTSSSWNTNIVSGNNMVKAVISAASQCLQPDSATSNLVEVKQNEGLSVYPNPTTGEVIITGLMPNDDIGLYNSIGQRIFTTTGNNILRDQSKLHLTKLASGTYMISIKRNEKIFVKKIVKLPQ
ncbi:MAG: T9SS type A sorting domain-containing protein, partial [Ferruginibacter sp.]